MQFCRCCLSAAGLYERPPHSAFGLRAFRAGYSCRISLEDTPNSRWPISAGGRELLSRTGNSIPARRHYCSAASQSYTSLPPVFFVLRFGGGAASGGILFSLQYYIYRHPEKYAQRKQVVHARKAVPAESGVNALYGLQAQVFPDVLYRKSALLHETSDIPPCLLHVDKRIFIHCVFLRGRGPDKPALSLPVLPVSSALVYPVRKRIV